MATSSMSVGVLASLLLSVLLTAARVALADAFAVELFVETDYVTANSDLTQTMYSVAFAVNDNLSISYGNQETEKAGSTVDQKVTGFSVGYSMGGMTIKAHNNKGENIANQTANESEHTEIAVSFAF